MSQSKIFARNIASLIILGIVYFVFQDHVGYALRKVQQEYFACRQPITYTIGTIDERFDITKEELLSAILESEKIWESATGQNLFQYKTNGHLKFNMTYDNRQDATIRLQKTDTVLSDERKSYEDLHNEYIELKALHENLLTKFKIAYNSYTKKQNLFDQKVAHWNSLGGAPEQEYKKLQTTQQELDKERISLLKLQSEVNATVTKLNSRTASLNKQASEVNELVDRFNTINSENGEEFQEGVYRSELSGDSITVYQYDSRQKLVRLLAHEMGHALGIEHLSDPESIMHKYNNSNNLSLTQADIAEVRQLCKTR